MPGSGRAPSTHKPSAHARGRPHAPSGRRRQRSQPAARPAQLSGNSKASSQQRHLAAWTQRDRSQPAEPTVVAAHPRDPALSPAPSESSATPPGRAHAAAARDAPPSRAGGAAPPDRTPRPPRRRRAAAAPTAADDSIGVASDYEGSCSDSDESDDDDDDAHWFDGNGAGPLPHSSLDIGVGDALPDAASAERQESFDRIMNPVVKVYCRHTEPNFSLPWQRERQVSSSSSGFAILGSRGDERWLLTNAHSVEYYSQVRVKRRGDDRKYPAHVLAVGTECDLALLGVKDPEFWEGMQPMALGPLPRLQENVAVVGYPVGGDTVSITAGVVSRIEVTSYVHGSMQLLGIQIDAAINSGNSGGPVFDNAGQLVGVAFQSYAGSEVENVGWVIPTTVIAHFLKDFERHGAYTGFPKLGVQWQRMESDSHKRYLKMKDPHNGVLITHVMPTGSCCGTLKEGDVLLEFDGHKVSTDGTTQFRTGERIMYSFLVSQRFVGERVAVKVLRGGEAKTVEVQLRGPHSLIPPHLANRDPSYFVLGGLVFTVITEPYLSSEYGEHYHSMAPVALLDLLWHGVPKTRAEEAVVVSQVLACDTTVGYEDVYNERVERFNGEKVLNLRHLVALITACTAPYFNFALASKEVVVLDAADAREATKALLKAHNIPKALSDDLDAPAPALAEVAPPPVVVAPKPGPDTVQNAA